MTSAVDPQPVLDRWLPAFLDGRRAERDVYAEQVVTWHASSGSMTQIDVDGSEDPSFTRLRAVVPDLRREDVKVQIFEGGWMLQATTVGTVDGEEVRVPACIIARLDEAGQIARFEEYADSTSAAPFVRVLQRG